MTIFLLLGNAFIVVCLVSDVQNGAKWKPAVIKYLNLKGLTPNEISSDMKVVLGDDVPSCATIYRWIAEFQRGRESTEDVHRSGRPVDACTEGNDVSNGVSTTW